MRHTRPGDRLAVRIEAHNEWAWCGERRLELTPKAFAVLRHLVEHAGRLITKDGLLTAVWGDTVVSEAALTSCIRDVRKALADSSRAPRYIETVHRRGFRFIGPVVPPSASLTAPGSRAPGPDSREAPTAVSFPHPTGRLVGRDAELARLHALFQTAVDGRRRLVFVTGEAGIGKTALVEAFAAEKGGSSERHEHPSHAVHARFCSHVLGRTHRAQAMRHSTKDGGSAAAKCGGPSPSGGAGER